MKYFKRHLLKDFAQRLLTLAGLDEDKAEVVSELLIQTDEMGVTTHGISMVPYYVPELENGSMARTGSYKIVTDRGEIMVWDGNYQPGLWLMQQAINLGMERVQKSGVVTVSIRRSHHIGCLSTLMRIAAEKGFVCILTTSDPSGKWVAPFGGTEPALTPNPWGVGYPTKGHPVLIDFCASITTVSKVRELINTDSRFDFPWMLNGNGNPTTDPNVVNHEPMGSILPLGGIEYGYKGFGLGIMVEMLTQGLSGYGRIEEPERWGGNVFLQIIDPNAFAGLDRFTAQVEHFNTLCRNNRPAPGVERVRLPGERCYAHMKMTRETGVPVKEEIWKRLAATAQKYDVDLPEGRDACL